MRRSDHHQAPPYVFPLLILSKRLHSVFVLRCFNDCFAAFFLWLTVLCFQRRQWALGALVYSWGLGVKMSLLLSLPAVGVILFLSRGLSGALRLALMMFQVQVALGLPFMTKNAWGYLGRAFELSRKFLFKWTVNWRFVGEDVFLSRPFAIGLLALHGAVLLAFVATRWVRSLLFETQTADPMAIGGSLALLIGAAALAAILPARRAARIDPIEVLRNE